MPLERVEPESQTQWYVNSLDNEENCEVSEKRIGWGARGEVFEGKFNGKIVAVKKSTNCDGGEISKEFEILKKLKHRNIIEFFYFQQKSTFSLIFMEYCEKGNLSDYVRANVIDKTMWMEWIRQITDGMLYLHENKIIHRDLKGPNILINSNDILRICDFGESRGYIESISQKMTFRGTFNYMAPEVLQEKKYSKKVDVYSFGMVLWEMLTGHTPFSKCNLHRIIYAVGRGILTLAFPPNSPRNFERLIRLCVSYNSKLRPSFKYIQSQFDIWFMDIMDIENWEGQCNEWHEYSKEIQYGKICKEDPDEKLYVKKSTPRILFNPQRKYVRSALELRRRAVLFSSSSSSDLNETCNSSPSDFCRYCRARSSDTLLLYTRRRRSGSPFSKSRSRSNSRPQSEDVGMKVSNEKPTKEDGNI
ncbi:unnamed protein product [Caenorhabditis angaria]|uniref:Protein kinase domain-containing protein n=1 Tax=Caenorhabditis angaria TaxID=860376 RepID=A0A9P1N9D5_9PELO|nr:unnamed protein product [Caenorhabditis angaria]